MNFWEKKPGFVNFSPGTKSYPSYPLLKCKYPRFYLTGFVDLDSDSTIGIENSIESDTSLIG